MSEEYKQGFRDGYRDAMEAFKSFRPEHVYMTAPNPNTPQVGQITGTFYQCPTCKIAGTMALVCNNPKCPTRVTSTFSNISITRAE